jgi:hypothetical protein
MLLAELFHYLKWHTFVFANDVYIANVAHMFIYLFSLQHGTIMDFARLYEVSNIVDEHRDMRLDIDSMTYEVLNDRSSIAFCRFT